MIAFGQAQTPPAVTVHYPDGKGGWVTISSDKPPQFQPPPGLEVKVGPPEEPKTDWTPWVIGGAAVLVVAVVALRR